MTETLRQKQSRQCVQCGAFFATSIRHPYQKTCGKKCPKNYETRRARGMLEKRRVQYREDAAQRAKVVSRTWAAKLRKVYGMTPDDYRRMFDAQGGRCAVCKEFASCTSVLGNEKVALFVDHDHASGAVRGLLCHGCNIAAGSLKDDPSRAERLAIYLRRGGYE